MNENDTFIQQQIIPVQLENKTITFLKIKMSNCFTKHNFIRSKCRTLTDWSFVDLSSVIQTLRPLLQLFLWAIWVTRHRTALFALDSHFPLNFTVALSHSTYNQKEIKVVAWTPPQQKKTKPHSNRQISRQINPQLVCHSKVRWGFWLVDFLLLSFFLLPANSYSLSSHLPSVILKVCHLQRRLSDAQTNTTEFCICTCHYLILLQLPSWRCNATRVASWCSPGV